MLLAEFDAIPLLEPPPPILKVIFVLGSAGLVFIGGSGYIASFAFSVGLATASVNYTVYIGSVTVWGAG